MPIWARAPYFFQATSINETMKRRFPCETGEGTRNRLKALLFACDGRNEGRGEGGRWCRRIGVKNEDEQMKDETQQKWSWTAGNRSLLTFALQREGKELREDVQYARFKNVFLEYGTDGPGGSRWARHSINRLKMFRREKMNRILVKNH